MVNVISKEIGTTYDLSVIKLNESEVLITFVLVSYVLIFVLTRSGPCHVIFKIGSSKFWYQTKIP